MRALALLLAMATPAMAADWSRYEIVMWHNSPSQLAGARALGVTAGMVFGVREPGADVTAELTQRIAPFRAAGLGFYVGNVATDFYAAYHRWQPDHPLTWLFDQAHARLAADRADPAAFMREPSLSDPAALAAIRTRLRAHARALAGTPPLYISLGDETGIADLTATWDFDFSPTSLAAMRGWLRAQYGTLDALNREWGTDFAGWDEVRPQTTDAALRRSDGNFAGWADFKTFMDVAFAAAIRAGTDAVHGAGPAVRAAIEGAQAPGWGGYDYTLLAGAVDVMEITATEQAQDIAQALNPALITLTTVTGETPDDTRRLWNAAVAGGRGVILWDPDAALIRPDGTPGPRWPTLAGAFADLTGPIGAALLASEPQRDAVGILYSPASFRIQWLLDRQADLAAGKDWTSRSSETELEDNAVRAALRQAGDDLAHLGLTPHWLSPALLAGGGLDGLRAVILPHALALSGAEWDALDRFVARGGTVLADVAPGQYDDHARSRDVTWQGAALLPGLPRATLAVRLAQAGVTPAVSVTADGHPAADVTVRARRLGDATLLAVQRDAMAPATVVLQAPGRMLRDLRGGAPATRLELRLDGVTPALVQAR